MGNIISYSIRNVEMLSIDDKRTSQEGQSSSLTYIPGSSIRGAVVNAFSKDLEFETYKKQLLSSKVRFLSAWPMVGEGEGMPPIKGFYEDKSQADEKEIYSVVVDGETKSGTKRANLGNSCLIKDSKILYSYLPMTDSMNICIFDEEKGDSDVFRQNYIAKNQNFTGYVYAEDDSMAELIMQCLMKLKYLYVGNNRSTGHGKCEITDVMKKVEGMYNQKYTDYSQECYMVLLSNTVVRNELGEYCGFSNEYLANKLEQPSLSIIEMATSTTEVHGYNQTLGGDMPTTMMYEAGSVFHLTFDGTISSEVIHKVTEQGIGERRNEGFGQVLILDKEMYEKINTKKIVEPVSEVSVIPNDEEENKKVLETVARRKVARDMENRINEFITNQENYARLRGATPSLLGSVLAICSEHCYQKDGIEKISEFLVHLNEKNSTSRVHAEKKRSDLDAIREMTEKTLFELLQVKSASIFSIPMEQILSKDEQEQYKRLLITRFIKLELRRRKIHE